MQCDQKYHEYEYKKKVNLTLTICHAQYEVPCLELITESQKIGVFVGIRNYFLTVPFVCHNTLYIYWSSLFY